MDKEYFDSLIDISLFLKDKQWFLELCERKKKIKNINKFVKNNFKEIAATTQIYARGYIEGYEAGCKDKINELRDLIYQQFGIDIGLLWF